MAGNKFGASGSLPGDCFRRVSIEKLSDADVAVGVLGGFERVVDLLVASSKLRDVTRDFARVFAFDDYSCHEICYVFHLRFLHSQSCYFGDSASYPSRGFEVSSCLDIVR